MTLSQIREQVERLDREATKGPMRVDGKFTCNRTPNDPKDVHYSVFDEDCGVVAHFWKKSDAEQYAYARTALPRLLRIATALQEERDKLKEALEEIKPLRGHLDKIECIRIIQFASETAKAALSSLRPGDGTECEVGK